jgi:hypothetical protein
LSQEAVGMTTKLVTIANQAIIGGVIAVGATFITFSFIYMALLSRLE